MAEHEAARPRSTTAPARTWDLTGPAVGWDPDALVAFRHHLAQAAEDADAWRTPPRLGLWRLRVALADSLRLDPTNLTITGSVRHALVSLRRPGETVAVEVPSFSGAPRLFAETGEVVRRSWRQLTTESLPPSVTTTWVTSPCRNPDGRTLTRDEADAMGDLVAEGRRVIVDQVYRWLAPASPVPEGAVLVGGTHKLACGGMGLGWQWDPAGPGSERPPVPTVPTVWQHAWAAFIEEGGIPRLVKRGMLNPSRRAARLRGILEDAGMVTSGWPGPTFLLHGSAEASFELERRLAEHGVRVSPGLAFDAGYETVRISATGIADNDVVQCAAAIVRALLGGSTVPGESP